MTGPRMWIHDHAAFLDGDDGGDGDEASAREAGIRAFEVVFLLILLVEYWARALPKWGGLAPTYTLSLALATVLCPLGLYLPARRAVFGALAVLHAMVIWQEFPAAGNHAYLELLLCLLCAGLDARRDGDRVLFLRAVRWVVCLVFFYSGVQKLAHGYWSKGQYLAFSVWIESFRPVLSPMIPAEEMARLVGYSRQVGDGPYLVATPLLAIVSNVVCVAEILIGAALAWKPTRAVAFVAAVVLMAGIQAGARELFFALVMLDALLLFLPGLPGRRAVPAFAVVLVILLLSRVGAIPEMTFY